MQDFQYRYSSPLASSEYLSGRQKNLKMYLNKHRNNRTGLPAKTKRQNKTAETNLKCRNGKGPRSTVGRGTYTRLQSKVMTEAKDEGSKGGKAMMKSKQ